jgi:hypothetical protein
MLDKVHKPSDSVVHHCQNPLISIRNILFMFLFVVYRTMQVAFDGLFPRDDPKNTRFAINFFTSIGLGGLTWVYKISTVSFMHFFVSHVKYYRTNECNVHCKVQGTAFVFTALQLEHSVPHPSRSGIVTRIDWATRLCSHCMALLCPAKLSWP